VPTRYARIRVGTSAHPTRTNRHKIYSVRMRAGFPATVAPSGTSRVTTLPAPTMALSPIRTPGRMIAPPPIQTLQPMARPHRSQGFGQQRVPDRRRLGQRGVETQHPCRSGGPVGLQFGIAGMVRLASHRKS
jgi:hypothetical protein